MSAVEALADGTYPRTEKITYDYVTQKKVPVPFKGPFDYKIYNDTTQDNQYASAQNNYSIVNRPEPWLYKAGQAQAYRGVEVELLCDKGGATQLLGNTTFTDPTALNALGTPDKPVMVYSQQLRYRVRFCYPVDPKVDKNAGTALDLNRNPSVDLKKHYLLDTPVFEGISVTYMIPPRILDFHEVTE